MSAEEKIEDLSSLGLRQVLNELSQSIIWLGTLREREGLTPDKQRDVGMAAVALQAKVAEAYRALLQTIDLERRVEAAEQLEGLIRGEVLDLRERLQGEEE